MLWSQKVFSRCALLLMITSQIINEAVLCYRDNIGLIERQHGAQHALV